MTTTYWEITARSKKSSIGELIPKKWKLKLSDIPPVGSLRDVTEYIRCFLEPQELAITDANATFILDKLRVGRWTALEVTRAFCHRAALAHQFVNCLSEICFDAAETRAQELDAYFLRHGKTLGPLHGLPISLKDRFHVKGLDSACGYVSWLGKNKTAEDEGVLVQRLRQMGAILYVKTNVPMSMLMGETNNNIMGSTINPYNRNLNAGGATGGEGALLALKGSPLGWGSDIAGSVRIPCAFNSLFGLRPSFGRFPGNGLGSSLPGMPTAVPVVGPMAPDIPSLKLALKTMLESSPWEDDYETNNLPWDDGEYQKILNSASHLGQNDGNLCFGIMQWDGKVQPHPPVVRAIRLVVEALTQRGYQVIPWNPPSHPPAIDLLFQIFGSTAGQGVRDAINASGEPPIHQLKAWFESEDTEPSATTEFWALCQQREQYRAQYHKYWYSTKEMTRSKRPVDAVILPVAPSAAVEEGFFGYYAYSAIANVLDYTAGSFPVTFADRSLDPKITSYTPKNVTDRSVWNTYNPNTFEGAPIGLQLMGRRLQEERVVAMMEAVTDALQQYRGVGNTAR